MDNLTSHKNDAVRTAIERVGAELLFLQPYSPDLNSVEQVFAKLKQLLRRAARRTMETLRDEIGKLLDRFPQKNAQITSETQDTASPDMQPALAYFPPRSDIHARYYWLGSVPINRIPKLAGS